MFGNIGAAELIIILVLALIIFGPGKLPEVGKAIGRSIREFKAASSAVDDNIKEVTSTVNAAVQGPVQETARPAAATAESGTASSSAAAGTADEGVRS